MKWFKHMTESANDERLAKLISKHGLEAYGLWWLILEVVAKQMPKDGTKCEVSYPLSYWLRLTEVYHHSHLKKLLQSMTNLELISVQSLTDLGTISSLSMKDVLIISIPNLLKYRDEYSKKSVHNQEGVRSKKEKENKKENKDKTIAEPARHDQPKLLTKFNETFDWFWQLYATSEGRGRQGNKKKTRDYLVKTIKTDDDCLIFSYAVREYLQQVDSENDGKPIDRHRQLKLPEVFANNWEGYVPSDAQSRLEARKAKEAGSVNISANA